MSTPQTSADPNDRAAEAYFRSSLASARGIGAGSDSKRRLDCLEEKYSLVGA